MNASFPKYVPLVLVPAFLVAAGCGDRNLVAPTGTAAQSASVTAEPAALTAEFLSSPRCPVLPAFGTHLRILLRSHRDLTVTNIRFDFSDRAGVRGTPTVIPTTSGSSSMLGSSSPVAIPTFSSLPGASPIPVPGFSPLRDIAIGAGASETLPFFLQFGCGLIADGTIFIGVDTVDKRGFVDTTRIDLRLGR
jgi:hypothetical protein